MLKFCTITYTPNGGPQAAQSNIIEAGTPSVLLRRQFCHICGMSWMHHEIVPIVPKTLAAVGM